MPLNDYWNQILSAQGRGWGQWRAPSEMERTPEWSRARGGGGWGNTPSSSSFIAQTGQGFASPMGGAPMGPPMGGGVVSPNAPTFTPPMGGGVINPNAPAMVNPFAPPPGGGVVNPNRPLTGAPMRFGNLSMLGTI